MTFDRRHWALILGGSSGFGLATAQKLSREGMNICIVHRDRRAALPAIEAQFDRIRATGVTLLTFNRDATSSQERETILTELARQIEPGGGIRLLLHSIAFGNLKPLGTPPAAARDDAIDQLAAALGLPAATVNEAVAKIFAGGVDAAHRLAPAATHAADALTEDDFAHTIHAMGTSLVGWVQGALVHRLFAADARVIGLTSEGNALAWTGYAAVSAAKAVLESAARSLAVEFAAHGLRTNVVQPGITDTAALRHIPGQEQMKAGARLRNPFHRLTTPEDVANVIYLLCTDEAAWINGALIRVDGGEHVSGA